MRNYELALIADPEMDDKTLPELEKKVNAWIEEAGGKVLNIDRWGKRRLAYAIQKRNEGHYFIIQLEMPPQAGVEIEREIRLNEQILRYMISSVEPPSE